MSLYSGAKSPSKMVMSCLFQSNSLDVGWLVDLVSIQCFAFNSNSNKVFTK